MTSRVLITDYAELGSGAEYAGRAELPSAA